MSYDPRSIAFLAEILFQPVTLQADRVQQIHNALFSRREIAYQNFQIAQDGIHLSNLATSPGSVARLEKNFFDCIRSGKTPLGNIELALRAHVILSLAEMAERWNLTLLFDGKSRAITTADGRPLKPLSYSVQKPSFT